MFGSRARVVVSGALLGVCLANPVFAASPTEQLRAGIDRILGTFGDASLKSTDAAERRVRVRAIVAELFDWGETARRALGHHWPTLTDDQRQEFLRLFRSHLEHAYLSRLELYHGERIKYAAESIDGDLAMVRTKVMSAPDALIASQPKSAIGIDYLMIRRGDQWRVYDVVLDGVSVVNNYHKQFDAIIQRSSWDGLLTRMKAKQAERQ
jgi:phospholipid transport system substrate-binding protein